LDRADYFLGVYINILTAVNNNKLVSIDDFQFKPLQVVTCYPGFSPSVRGKRLRLAWDQGILNLHESGKLKAIFDKWQLEYPNYQWQQNTAQVPSEQ